MQSVPYNRSLGVEQITWIQRFLEFQSTLAYLKDPPSTYAHPAVDVMGGLSSIGISFALGRYTNEYDIELDIYKLIQSAHDGHLLYRPTLVEFFGYNRNVSLVPVSLDGAQAPKVYFTCKSSFRCRAFSLNNPWLTGDQLTSCAITVEFDSCCTDLD